MALKTIEKMGHGSNHSIKKLSRGFELSEDNLSSAAIVSSGVLLKPIGNHAFKGHLKSVYQDKELDVKFLI